MRAPRVVSARPRGGTCTSDELPNLTAALDAEFIAGRGRSGSLPLRFPDLFQTQNLPRFFVRRHAGRIVSCCAARRFTWIGHRERWRGAMLGLVWTAPRVRGRGYAAQVLEDAAHALATAGIDFLVLWSGLEGFYERRGWSRHDRGIYGTVRGEAPRTSRPSPPLAADFARYEALRAAHPGARVERHTQSYRCIPLPADRVATIFAGEGATAAAALIGETADARYVYETIGAPPTLPTLWRQVTAGAQRVHVNESIGSPLHRWLARHTAIEFSAQELAYWRMLSPRARRASWRDWHIPYFDRI